jgi:hypothetical protein
VLELADRDQIVRAVDQEVDLCAVVIAAARVVLPRRLADSPTSIDRQELRSWRSKNPVEEPHFPTAPLILE